MSAIHQALGKLFQALDHLESAAGGAEAGRQNDLFRGMPGFDPEIMAYKIDAAIARVEQVLSEG